MVDSVLTSDFISEAQTTAEKETATRAATIVGRIFSWVTLSRSHSRHQISLSQNRVAWLNIRRSILYRMNATPAKRKIYE